ncbi:hypothetical protein ACI48D_04600 [Massilia sp. LXY-6]|uniref:hypothetical protein n=1 Tax=Massilia sp. LXY-6 TaxID=3379823 RepID=UPI003EDEF9B8
MRIKQVLAFLGAATVSTLALAEPALPVAVSSDGNTVIVQGAASRMFHLTPGQAQDTNGVYKLEDGRQLKLTSHNSKVFMEVDGRREELLPLSRTDFVARDSGARVALDEEAFATNIQLTQFRR